MCRVRVERIVLDLESEVMRGLGVTFNFFSKFSNRNLHNIARSDSLGLKTKNSIALNRCNIFTCKTQENIPFGV